MRGGRQPKRDIHAKRIKGASASAKGFPKADLQVCSVDPSDAAPGADVSEARVSDFAKSRQSFGSTALWSRLAMAQLWLADVRHGNKSTLMVRLNDRIRVSVA